MDDLTQKLQALLSDPESMKNLAELAAMLKEPDASAGVQTEAAPVPEPSAASGLPPLPDLGKLMAVGQALAQTDSDENAKLLLALKPHLSPERAKRAERAVRLLRLYRAAGILRETGMLDDLFGGQ